MELKDFISDSLVQIVEGVKAAQDHIAENAPSVHQSALISPHLSESFGTKDGEFRTHQGHHAVQLVEFDVAVTTGTRDEAQGGVGVIMAAIAVGVKGKEVTTTSEYSRLKFSVPVKLPIQDR